MVKWELTATKLSFDKGEKVHLHHHKTHQHKWTNHGFFWWFGQTSRWFLIRFNIILTLARLFLRGTSIYFITMETTIHTNIHTKLLCGYVTIISCLRYFIVLTFNRQMYPWETNMQVTYSTLGWKKTLKQSTGCNWSILNWIVEDAIGKTNQCMYQFDKRSIVQVAKW